jgi:hypothetical protein
MTLATCSLDSGCLHLLPASGLAGGSLPLGNDGRPFGSASVQPPCGESLIFCLRGAGQVAGTGTPGPERPHCVTRSATKRANSVR